jgi:hypothetical protein
LKDVFQEAIFNPAAHDKVANCRMSEFPEKNLTVIATIGDLKGVKLPNLQAPYALLRGIGEYCPD